jgi:hypothetical protein
MLRQTPSSQVDLALDVGSSCHSLHWLMLNMFETDKRSDSDEIEIAVKTLEGLSGSEKVWEAEVEMS